MRDLKKSYVGSNFALRNVSFSIPYGSIVGFIGENGAGKTTTMGTILGTLKKDSGDIKIFGEGIEKIRIAKNEDIGVVFDNMNFSGNLDVTKLSKVLSHVYKQWNQEKYFYYINLFALPKKDKIQGFSRGMSMKLSIAVALSHDAKLLILDEATAGLDPVARAEILEVFLEFVKDQKRSIILSSHITSDIEKVADDLIFIKKGKIILQISKNELLHNYGIVHCTQDELQQIDPNVIVTFIKKADTIQVLVSNKHKLATSFQIKNGSIDEISLLLMKGEKNERTHS